MMKRSETLREEETNIRNKLLAVLTAQQKRETQFGKDCLLSINFNGILDLSDDETHKQIKKSLNKDQISWLEGVLQKKNLETYSGIYGISTNSRKKPRTILPSIY
ncbi:4843_t:CDS:2 [Acaulospora colombiana]|uniref:4843_t:CDS:1 n=1 Tax=Acaulospora colombiana TaxID=27376 RepID=A0ACA9K4T8_9GLOM|nr:4843_t:CDS:2 [Acaulospora colombiana]